MYQLLLKNINVLYSQSIYKYLITLNLFINYCEICLLSNFLHLISNVLYLINFKIIFYKYISYSLLSLSHHHNLTKYIFLLAFISLILKLLILLVLYLYIHILLVFNVELYLFLVIYFVFFTSFEFIFKSS